MTAIVLTIEKHGTETESLEVRKRPEIRQEHQQQQ